MLTEEDKAWIEQQFELAGGQPVEPEPERPVAISDRMGIALGLMLVGLLGLSAWVANGWLSGVIAMIFSGIFVLPAVLRKRKG